MYKLTAPPDAVVPLCFFPYLRDADKTHARCLDAVSHEGYLVQCVPRACMTREVLLAAVNTNSDAIQFIPLDLRTPEICLTAVRGFGSNLKYVPVKLRTMEICQAAVLSWYGMKRCDPETLLWVAKGFWRTIDRVPMALRTPELFLEAVRNDPMALVFVPAEHQTPEVCEAAYTRDPSETLKHIHDRQILRNLIHTACGAPSRTWDPFGIVMEML